MPPVAVYTTHAIARSNTTHLFSELSMGRRLPVSRASRSATSPRSRARSPSARPLAPAVRRWGVDIDAPLIDDLARKHRALLYAQRALARLAEATPWVGRKEEMKRIFGVEI